MAVLAVHGIQYERKGNACRAAMLQGAEPVSQRYKLPEVIDENLVEGLRLLQCMLDDYRERNYGHAHEWIRHIDRKFAEHSESHEDDAYSIFSSLLQGAEPVSQRDELPFDYLQGQKDGLEWAAQLAEANHPQTGDWLYDDPIELAKAIRKGPDMPEPAGNSPVIPDGWVACSERMPETAGNYWGWWSESKRQGPVWFIKSELQSQFQSSEITHWMPLPAAPQQEVE
ncbi:DUF551 domain-containing protein [Escherichia coli]|uniref:DUF551 domain-containing protein n=1 Tax=Escherichia coli TaxID=562 RepID=UPI002E116EC2